MVGQSLSKFIGALYLTSGSYLANQETNRSNLDVVHNLPDVFFYFEEWRSCCFIWVTSLISKPTFLQYTACPNI